MKLIPKAIALCLCMAGVSSGFAADPNSLIKMKEDEAFNKLGPIVDAVRRAVAAMPAPFARAADEALLNRLLPHMNRLLPHMNRLLPFDRQQQCIVVDAVAAHDAEALTSAMKAMGMHGMSSYGRVTSGCLPLSALDSVAASKAVKFLRPPLATTHVGSVTSQGDHSMRTDEVREFTGVDGRGVRVGVLSDSFGCLQGPLFEGNPFTTVPEDVANDDLPPDVRVLSDFTAEDCIDEGRAMLQLIHDVAPGAAGAFHTALNGQADFANGILELAYQAGSDVIVDDIIYFAEPMFADGIIAQAADIVKGWGVPYFSAAGNYERMSYESDFRPSGSLGLIGERHDFDSSEEADPLQSVTVGSNGLTIISFQWDAAYFSVSGAPGSASDLDFLFYFGDGSPVDVCSFNNPSAVCQVPGIEGNVGGDPIEVLVISNGLPKPINLNVSIELYSGPAPNLIKYVVFEQRGSFILNQFDTESPTLYGHANAAGAEAVGAAVFSQTEEFPQPDPLGLVDVACIPACLNEFSSAGGVPIWFDRAGNRLTEPLVRKKPGITGPDGGNTTFFFQDSIRDEDELPNFFGTSASAPHVAAATALAISARREGIAQEGKFRMCKTKDNRNIEVEPSEALELLKQGVRFRDCNALQPDAYLDALHATAQDMSLRAFPAVDGGTAVPVSDAEGFDFDTGFGFVDALEFFDVVTGE